VDANTTKGMNAKLILGLVLAGFVVFFTLQNAETIELRFLIWTLVAPRAVMVLGVLAIGIVIGWILHSWVSHRKPSVPVSASSTSPPLLSDKESHA
jgi:uncharacterized integral membrane protein